MNSCSGLHVFAEISAAGTVCAVAPRRVTKNSVVSMLCRPYLRGMMTVFRSFLMRRLTALFTCLALVVMGISATAVMEHGGPAADPAGVALAEAADVATGHEAHHMAHGASSEPECCALDTKAASSCHVSACCLAALQFPDLFAASEFSGSACVRSMESVNGPSVYRSLPERPPRLS
jgi:hypothetical protein